MEAYIEKELTEIVYIKGLFGRKPVEKKTRYGFLFDLYAWLNMSHGENISLTDIGQWDDSTFMLNMSYYGAISACKERGAKVTFTKENIGEFLSKLPNPDFKDIFNTILQSRFMGKSLEEWAEQNMKSEDTKKKSGRKTSKITQSPNLG